MPQDIGGDGGRGWGVKATQLEGERNNEKIDKIVIRSGISIFGNEIENGHGFGDLTGIINLTGEDKKTAPYRIKIVCLD